MKVNSSLTNIRMKQICEQKVGKYGKWLHCTPQQRQQTQGQGDKIYVAHTKVVFSKIAPKIVHLRLKFVIIVGADVRLLRASERREVQPAAHKK